MCCFSLLLMSVIVATNGRGFMYLDVRFGFVFIGVIWWSWWFLVVFFPLLAFSAFFAICLRCFLFFIFFIGFECCQDSTVGRPVCLFLCQGQCWVSVQYYLPARLHNSVAAVWQSSTIPIRLHLHDEPIRVRAVMTPYLRMQCLCTSLFQNWFGPISIGLL